MHFLRLAIVSLVMGAAATLAMAWSCAMWSPICYAIYLPNPVGIADPIDPDWVVGLRGRERGFGWEYTSLEGERLKTKGRAEVIWNGPYGGVYHRVAGWPFPALWSRVEVLDSQVGNRFNEGVPEPDVIVQQRRRWDLPAREIAYRGVATKDLPSWTKAYADRRLPLVPIALGFAIDTLIYGAVFTVVASGFGIACRRWRPAPRGFAVIAEGAA